MSMIRITCGYALVFLVIAVFREAPPVPWHMYWILVGCLCASFMRVQAAQGSTVHICTLLTLQTLHCVLPFYEAVAHWGDP
ncbi:uncharacterized protein DEA37_0002582 [Paragonimus westermani]|uniref:Uncharacterized protein n=1 Tax=Paragonimus westermani TaxID=34504 RepID=A0A5J4NZH4_9TREM|nr:uncharacterized protein DEA37_0002582 [Paragonimus westermani]